MEQKTMIVACTRDGKRIPLDTNHCNGYIQGPDRDTQLAIYVDFYGRQVGLTERKGITIELAPYTSIWDLPDIPEEEQYLPF